MKSINLKSEGESYRVLNQHNINRPKSKRNNSQTERLTEEELITRLNKRAIYMKNMSFGTKLMTKLYKNLYFLGSILLIVFVYLTYMISYLEVLLEISDNGGDYRFWLYLEDNYYRRGFINFIISHFLLIMSAYSFIVVLNIDPGFIDEEFLKYYSLVNHLNPNLADSLQQRSLFLHLKERSFKSSIKDNNLSNEDNFMSHKQISNDSFEALFVNEIGRAEDSNSVNNNNNDSIVQANEKCSQKDFYNKKDFFFKFMYYTDNNDIDDIKNNKNYCIFCNIIRPERARHCVQCHKCILKLDHHCAFLDFCIGLNNYKPFILFLFYLIAFFFFIFITMADGIYLYFKSINEQHINLLTIGFFILGFGLAGFGMGSVAELLIGHIYFILLGITTKEDTTNDNIELIFRLNDKETSAYENFIDVFGENILMWLIPMPLIKDVFKGYLWFKKDESYLEYIVGKRNDFLMDWNKELNQSINKLEEDV